MLGFGDMSQWKTVKRTWENTEYDFRLYNCKHSYYGLLVYYAL